MSQYQNLAGLDVHFQKAPSGAWSPVVLKSIVVHTLLQSSQLRLDSGEDKS